jgi:hypothetical protein
MLPWDMERLTRYQVFEVYLEREKDEGEGHRMPDGNSMTHRQQAFSNLGDMPWLEKEKAYQEWLHATGRRSESGRTATSSE